MKTLRFITTPAVALMLFSCSNSEAFSWSQEAMGFWALIVASISLGWQIIAAAYRHLIKAEVRISSHAPLQISYNSMGLLVLVSLVIRSKNKPAEIGDITLQLRNVSTDEKRHAPIAALYDFVPPQQPKFGTLLEPQVRSFFSPFIAAKEQTVKLNALFIDSESFEALKTKTQKAQEYASELLEKAGSAVVTEEIAAEFNTSKIHQELWDDANDALYLKPARYEATISVTADEKISTTSFHFEVTAEDYRLLKLNCVPMSNAVAHDQPGYIFQTIHPQLESV